MGPAGMEEDRESSLKDDIEGPLAGVRTRDRDRLGPQYMPASQPLLHPPY